MKTVRIISPSRQLKREPLIDNRLAMAVVVRAGLVLMQRRWRRGTGFVHEFPGGRAEPGETLVRTAARELLEETGLVESNVAHEHRAESLDGGTIAFVVFDSSSSLQPVRTVAARHQSFIWLAPAEVPTETLAPADAEFVRRRLPVLVGGLGREPDRTAGVSGRQSSHFDSAP